MHLLEDLRSRGLLYQTSDEDLDRKLAALSSPEPIAAYAGFDPTANSLHVGHLVAIRGLMHAQRNGIRPIAVVGGATGLIGDPSFKDRERQLLSKEQVARNAEGLGRVLARFLDFDHPTVPALILNNMDWLASMSAIDLLRDVGKHFRVGSMLAKESVRARMDSGDGGVSYTEFSYPLLQGYDFYRLYKDHRCLLQVGGSDQWGNITAGIDLIRRLGGQTDVFGLTLPLITTSSGAKFGKSEGNAVWLSEDRTRPYDFHQFWLRVEDNDAGRYLRYFTFLPLDEIQTLERASRNGSGPFQCQQRLAEEMTRLVHGDAAFDQASSAAQIMYGGVIAKGIDDDSLNAAFGQVPTIKIDRSRMAGGWSLVDAAVETGLAKSKGEARRLIGQGGFYVNNQARSDPQQSLTLDDLVTATTLVLRSGKKNYRLVRLQG